MQTFLPFKDFRLSAEYLDDKRLGKQRVENLQLIQAMSGWKLITTEKILHPWRGVLTEPLPRAQWKLRRDPVGWTNHPCKKMWTGFEGLFRDYQYWVTTEWVSRGFKDTCWEKFNCVWNHAYEEDETEGLPWWYDDDKFHEMYQSLLIRKNPDYYRPLFPDTPDDIEFKFPV